MSTLHSGPTRATGANEQAADDLDDLFNYDVENDDVFGSNAQAAHEANTSQGPRTSQKRNAAEVDGLGIDEEIKITKRRAPAVKLDEPMLCSQRGIPELKKRFTKQMKFKGKGHEFSDVQRLLVLYQLWLDDLYPKATFRDALAMIERLGHGRSMQMRRRDWLSERRLGPSDADTQDQQDIDIPQVDAPGLQNVPSAEPQTPDIDDTAPIAASTTTDPVQSVSRDDGGLFVSDGEDDVPDDDELDALLNGGL